MPQKKLLIKTIDLKKDYATGDVVTKVLKDIDLEIRQGEFVAIMGPSGSGKSTLMHILGFLDRMTSGSYIFEEKNVANFSDDKLAQLRNQEVGFIFQSYNLLKKTSVLDNVKLPLIYSGMKKSEREKKAQDAVQAVGLEHRIQHYSNQLSGGEQQRVAIARALVNSPSVIFADEPTGNLDSKSGLKIMEIIQNLHANGTTIILVTHETSTSQYAERIIHIVDGKIQSDTPVTDQRFAKKETLLK